MKCGDCWYCKENYCSKWKSVISKEAMVTDCKSYTETKPSNKGLNKCVQKRANRLKRSNTMKPEQDHICRFVKIQYQDIQRINGKYKRIGQKTVCGLQIKNRVYLSDGKYKLINNKNTEIKTKYKEIPTWATDEMKSKYHAFKEKEQVNKSGKKLQADSRTKE